MSTTLRPSPASTPVRRCNSPGRSARAIRRIRYRPGGGEAVADHPDQQGRVDVAAGEDEADGLAGGAGSLPARAAASGAAPAGSTTVFVRSRSRSRARERSSSETVTMSSTSAVHVGQGQSDTRFTAIPSAMVSMRSRVTTRPAARDADIDAAPSASTPTSLTSGRSALRAAPTPLMSPPPPMATATVPASAACSASSRPSVPCPAMTSGSSNGETNVAPRPLGVGEGAGQAVVEHDAAQHDLGAVPPGGRHLGERRRGGHEDRRPHPEEGGGQGDPLGVVPGAGRHHPGGPLGGIEPGDPVVGPPGS